MRTSSQLRKSDNCPSNPNAQISQNSDVLKRAVIQKRLVKRLLKGEPITNIRAELANMFDAENYIWDSESDRNATLTGMAARIDSYVNWEMRAGERRHKIFSPTINDEPITVNYFGETVQALPDFIIDNDDAVTVCKIKTGSYKSTTTENILTAEGYCLGLAGKKFVNASDNPNRDVIVQYLYLRTASKENEMAVCNKLNDTYLIPYDTTDTKYNRIAEAVFTDSLKEQYEEIHEEESKEDNSGCSPEKCSGCSMQNVCQYVEPPIPAPISESLRDWGELHLSTQQKDVINFDSGVARVNAGPGAGKTLTVAIRVADLVIKGNDPEKICLLTFTKAGAGEMTARAVDFAAFKGVPVDESKFTSTTFNSFCQGIINDNYELLGFSRHPRIVPDETRRAIVNRILDQFPHISGWKYGTSENRGANKDKPWLNKGQAFQSAINIFSDIKANGYTRDNYPNEWLVWNYKTKSYNLSEVDLDYIFLMYDEFQLQLKERDLIEYNDQILLVEQLYENNPDLFNEMGFEHIIVDEFQDTDLPQIKLLQKMIDTQNFKSMMAVGDDSQSIFMFRHTSPEYMVHFGEYFGRFTSLDLIENFRSTRSIVNNANAINDQQVVKVDKTLVATDTKPNGPLPSVHGFYTPKQEFNWIAKQIKEKWDAGNHDIAVIMSDRYQIADMADALTKLGIPSTLKSPVLVKQNSRVNALTTFYDSFMGNSTQGFVDYKNCITHGGMKGKSANELETIVDEFKCDLVQCDKSVDTFMAFAKALDEEEIDECYQNFLEKVESCRDLDELIGFFEDFKIYGDESTYTKEGKYDGVCLTTVHSSKGLEWDTTFLCLDKLDDEKYHRNPTRHTSEIDEKYRLWFVGATRARKELIQTGCAYLSVDNKNRTATRNTFVEKAHELCGKAFNYNLVSYQAAKAKEKAESEADKNKTNKTVTNSNTKAAINHVLGKTDNTETNTRIAKPKANAINAAIKADMEEIDR